MFHPTMLLKARELITIEIDVNSTNCSSFKKLKAASGGDLEHEPKTKSTTNLSSD